MPDVWQALSRLLPRRSTMEAELQSKASKAHRLVAIDHVGAPVWAPRDYASFAREGFMQNAIVYRSVRMVAEAAASIPLLLYEGAQEIERHPFLDLVAHPSLDHTSADFFESWYGYLLVSGNGYVEAVGVEGSLRELHALRPDRLKVIPGADGWPEGYEYTVGGRGIRLQGDAVEGVRRVLHVRLFHPANDYYGMSPIEAAASAIDIHNEAARWNKALLDNSARPSGALVYASRDGNLTEQQFERLKEELEIGFAGARAAGRPMLLEGGLDWKQLSLSPKDMDFVEAKNAAAREIALALGVPPMLLGIPGDNTYSNYQEASRSFWRQTVLPLVNRTAKAMSMWLAPAWGGGLELRPDLDAIEALSSERDQLWARLEKASFLTVDEKRAAAGYGPIDGGEGGGLAAKYNPYHDELGRFTTAEGAGGGSESAARQRNDDGLLHDVSRRRAYPGASIAQQIRLDQAHIRAQSAMRQLRELDPDWRAPQSLTATIEGETAHWEAVARSAEARLGHSLRDAIPGSNPSWGVNRLTKELYDQGYVLRGPARGAGMIHENLTTGDQVRIMERPQRSYRNETRQKHFNDYYYRYMPYGRSWGGAITIPDKR